MPGTSLVYGTKLVESSIQGLRLEDDFVIDKVVDTENFGLVKSGFEGYPFIVIKDDQFTALVEGIVYNIGKDEFIQRIRSIVQSYGHKGDYKEIVQKLIESSFGEFLVTINMKETGDVLLFNDCWGRLPCFFFSDSSRVVISREPKFILHYLPHIRYNKFAIIEYIVLRYPLGDRTVFEGIKRLPPGTLITISLGSFSCIELVPLQFTLDTELNPSKAYYVEKAKDILLESTKQILGCLNEFKSQTVDISGGYDSRLVLAAVSKFDKSVIPNSVALITGDESETARAVTEALGLDILHIKPKRIMNFGEIQRVLFMTDAFVNGLTVHTCYEDKLELLEKLNRPIVNFQGFGGEFLRHPLRHKRHYKRMTDVIADDVLSTSLIQTCCMSVGVSTKDLFEFWTRFFDSTYSEVTMRDRVMHYYFDYYRLLVMEGEDRTRLHVWPISPMMSWLQMATTSFPREMADFDFFEHVISVVEPVVSVKQIPIWGNAFWRSRLFKAIDNSKLATKLGMIYFARKWKRKAMKSPLRNALVEKALELYDSTSSIQETFSRDMIVRFLETEYGPSNRYVWQLLSIFMYMNSVEEKYG